jgi:hypothetical protein
MLHTRQSGSMVILVIVFGAVFATLLFGLSSFVLTQKRATDAKEHGEQALQIAEAGLEYYKWFLAHHPGDVTDGTGGTGPYEHVYTDPEGGDVGAFSLDIQGSVACGEMTSIAISSTGWVDEDPVFTRTVFGRYTRPSVADFAYILNDNVWAGPDREIYGPYHSNFGIRMDGTNYSVVTSGVEDWTCTSSFDCVPSQTADGVFGSGPNDHLWSFPAETVDFAGIVLDIAHMKDLAQNGGGVYLPKISNHQNRKGYHLIFRDDGTVDVYKVHASKKVNSSPVGKATGNNYEKMVGRNYYATYTISEICPLIFVEDNLWIEGTVSGKATVVAGNVINTNVEPNVYITDDIEYADNSVVDGLTVLGEGSVLIGCDVPYNLELSGVFIAQTGSFGRNYYNGSFGIFYNSKGTLEMTGSIVSNGRVGTQWTYTSGGFAGGFLQRINHYDRQLANNPPPFTPYMDDEYRFVEWREE